MDASLALSLNKFALHFKWILPLLSDWMVFIVFALGALWIFMHHIGRYKAIAIDFIFTMAFPIAASVVISETLSKIFDRARPFVADKQIVLLIPHDPDGGFPSHHTTVMVAIAVALWYRNHNLGRNLFILSIISGIARVGAGIHYPTDILAGAVIGAATSWVLHKNLKHLRLRFLSK